MTDLGDVPLFRWRPDPVRLLAVNVEAVRDTALALAERVAAAMQAGADALVLGGDCTVELGTVAGALRVNPSVGLIYIDLDADLNSPPASDGALDWTGIAHLLDLPGTEPALSGLGPREPMLSPQDVLLFGTDNLEREEPARIFELGLQMLALHTVQDDPEAAARQALAWGARFDRLLVHLDVDVLAYVAFPIAENVRRGNGLRLTQLATVLDVLLAAPQCRALTVAEVNPDHAPDEEQAFAALIKVLSHALGARSGRDLG